MKLPFVIRIFCLCLATATPLLAAPYKRLEQVEGALLMLSSPKASNAAILLLDGFLKNYPTIKTSLEGPYSTSEVHSLLNGFSNIVLTDKTVSPEYRQYFLDRHGVLPTWMLAFRTKDGKDVSLGTLIYMPKDLDIVIVEFISFVYSDDGTKVIEACGFKPVSEEERKAQLAKLTQRGPSK